MENLQIVEYDNIRVLTTRQLAEVYQTDNKTLSNNFNNNRERYIPGKHYIILEGEELRDFKSHSENLGIPSTTSKIILWTEKGCFLAAKSLNTDRAWEAYDKLIDGYFTVRQELVDRSALSPQMQMFYAIADAQARQELEQKKMAERIDRVEQKLSATIQAVEPIRPDTWRKDITAKFNRIQKASGIPFDELRIETYKELDWRAGVDVAIRCRNKKQRLFESGATKTQIDRVTRMDIIQEDKKLRQIYERILADYEVRYCV